MLRPRNGARLHLGCGEVIFSGFLNVDLPGNGDGPRPDLEADLHQLRCPADSLDVIRLHHVFEQIGRAHV